LRRFQRIERLWRLYHDSGHLSVARAADDTCSVLVRIVDLPATCSANGAAASSAAQHAAALAALPCATAHS
jgi:hypothetical protein